MEEIFGAEVIGEEFTTFKMVEWWYQEGTTIIAFLKGFDRRFIVRDELKHVRPTQYEKAVLADGKRFPYLLYRDDYCETVPVSNWQIETEGSSNWLGGLYLTLAAEPNIWFWSKGCPRITIRGEKRNGLKNRIESDPIKAILKIGNDFFAVSRRHKFLLKGDPVDMAERLAPLLHNTAS